MHKSRFATANLLIILCLTLGAAKNFAQTTVFTYQGKLTDSAMAANGSYDFQFALYDAATGGNLVASNSTATTGVAVTNGVFTVQLNFGAAAFPGADRYLEIQVKKPADSNYTPLAPRQQITSAPNAIRSLNATNANQLGGVNAANYLQTNGSGANLTNLNASNITNGSLADAQLSANVAFRNQANTFAGDLTVNGDLSQTGTAADLNLTNGFLARGTYNIGAIPTTGAGTRMMFYLKKASFRVGGVTANQWDDANIGNYSTALGYNTTASGLSSTALGDTTIASGTHSTALGFGTTASSFYSTALGDTTIASGNDSTAMGIYTTASGAGSTALGNVTTASGDLSTAMGSYASTNGKFGSFVYGDDSTGIPINATTTNQFVVRAQRISLGSTNAVTNTANRFIETSTGAYLSTSGVWTDNSSVNLKTNFAALDSREVLRKVLNLRIQSWNYKTDALDIRHIGVMAQDFYKAFQVGADNEHITAVDTAGVTMAAIQGLNEKLENAMKLRDAKLSSQQTQIERQQKQIDALVKLFCASNASADVCNQEKK